VDRAVGGHGGIVLPGRALLARAIVQTAAAHVGCHGARDLEDGEAEMDDANRERLLRNEQFFRGANASVIVDDEGEGAETEPIECLCECSRVECVERIRISKAEWGEVHADPLRFTIACGHEVPEIEQVLARNERYCVIEKL
jgi:hypothetical protein